LKRFIEVFADRDRDITALKRDVGEARETQDLTRGVGVGHRERTRAARRLVVLVGSLYYALDDRLGAVQPVVVDAPSPHDHQELSARYQGLAYVAHRRDRACEEHRAEARECDIETSLAVEPFLNVGHEEACVENLGFLGLADGVLDEAGRRVDAHGLAVGSHEPGDPLGGVAKATAYVEHSLPRRGRMQAQCLLAVGAEPRRHGLAEAHEALIQRPVPRANRLLVYAYGSLGLTWCTRAHGPLLWDSNGMALGGAWDAFCKLSGDLAQSLGSASHGAGGDASPAARALDDVLELVLDLRQAHVRRRPREDRYLGGVGSKLAPAPERVAIRCAWSGHGDGYTVKRPRNAESPPHAHIRACPDNARGGNRGPPH